MSIKRILTTLFSAVLIFSASYPQPAEAHDIDIYVNSSAVTSGSVPMLMFSIDLRSNLGANACTGSECDALIAGGYLPAVGPYKQIDVYRASIKKVVQEEVIDKNLSIRLGLMMPHDHTNNCAGPGQSGCSNGGYIALGFQDINATDLTGFTAFKAKLDAIPAIGGSTAHKMQASEMYFELYRYLIGKDIYNGHNGWVDFGTDNTQNLPVDNAALSWDTTVENGTNTAYVSPITANCSKIYAVNFMFGTLNSDSNSDSAIEDTKANAGFGSNVANQNNNRFEDVLRYMYNADLSDGTYNASVDFGSKHNVTSFFLVPSPNQTENNFAKAGSGGNVSTAYDINVSPDALVTVLRNILKSILSTSTTFVAPSVSVNVYNRSQILSDIFIAMFQANEDGYPRWPGNIKKFKLGNNTAGELEIQSVGNVNAVNGLDGRIKHNAISYWTVTADLPAKTAADDFDNGTDGRTVARGGSGSKIPGFKLKCDNTDNTTDTLCTPGDYTVGMSNPSGNTTASSARKVFTDPASMTNGTPTALTPLNATFALATSLQTALGATSAGVDANTDDVCDDGTADTDATSACNLIKFIRGLNDDNTTNRPWLFADILHSRPVAINYGTYGGHTTANPNIRLFVGSNDGTLRMIRNTTSAGVEDGVEGWAFMPRKVMAIAKVLKQNLVTDPVTHPYGMDSSPVAYVKDVDGDGNIEPNGNDGSAATTADNDQVVLIFGLRRGGSSYYALDVTNPDDPKLLWRISKTSGGNFDEFGQTWSEPSVASMVFGGSAPTDVITPEPVIIVGGGYDPNKDDNTRGHTAATGGDDSQGNAIFIIKALTGDLVWKARFNASASTPAYNATAKAYERDDMKDSIPSRIAVIDTDGNSLADRIYVGDTGGVVWRGVLKSNNEADWVLKPILSVGRHIASATAADDRRFFSAPDYIQTKDSNGIPFDAIVLGSGDRANPLGTTAVNWFYMFKDKDTPRLVNLTYHNTPKSHTQLGDLSDNCLQDNPTDPGCNPVLTYGWRMKLECPPDYPASASDCGEKSLSAALTLGNTIFFSSYRPADASGSSCAPAEGTGLLYAVNLHDATAVIFNKGGTRKDDRYDTIASGGIPSSPVAIGGGRIIDSGLRIRTTNTPPGIKTFWYEKYFK